MRAIERRIDAGLDPRVASVASIFVSRWDNHASVRDRVSPQYRNRLGIAVAMRIYAAWCELIATPRWQRLASAGARPQRLLWASTGSKDPTAADTLYIDALAAADTVNTVPEKTLLAFADHGRVGPVLPADEGHAEVVLAEFAREGIDLDVLAATLQEEGLAAFVRSWHDLLARIDEKCRQPDLALLPDEPA
jgi:transaldolase